MLEQELLNHAKKARELSYSPYSNFSVGAAIEMKDGTVVYGANIENASYGLSMCAERNALFQAHLRGYKKEDMVQMALIASSNKLVSPCGACRQVLAELYPLDAPIIIATIEGAYLKTTAAELLPYAFDQENLTK